MKAKTQILLCVISLMVLCSSFQSNAQCTSIVIEGNVIDKSGHAVPGAAIVLESSVRGAIADKNGAFQISIPLPSTIRISSLGYQSLLVPFAEGANCDTVKKTYVLIADELTIPTVTVYSRQKTELVASGENILDFDTEHDHLVLFSAGAKTKWLTFYDSAFHATGHYAINTIADVLCQTLGTLVSTTDKDSTCFFQQGTSGLDRYILSNARVNRFVKPLMGLRFPFYYYYTDDMLNGGGTLWEYDKHTDSLKVLFRYENKSIARLNRESMSGSVKWAAGLRDDAGGSKLMSAITPEEMSDYRSKEWALWSKEQREHSALIKCGLIRDSLYVFNFENDSLYVFNRYNSYVRSLPVHFDHHGLKYDGKSIIVDDSQTECCFTYKVHGVSFLEKINLDNATSVSETRIDYPFLKKIRLQGNHVIFLYTDNNSKTYVYRQLLD